MADKHLKKVNAYWGIKNIIKKLEAPEEIIRMASGNALDWALKLAQREETFTSTAMKSCLADTSENEEGMVYTSRGEAMTDQRKKILLGGVSMGAPIQIQIRPMEEKLGELKKFIETHLKPIWAKRFPRGFRYPCNLWITGPGHQYDTHCDHGDHMLIQLAGKKKVHFWKNQNDFDGKDLFNFDFKQEPGRFFGEEAEHVVEAGEMAFFSRGVMHEVSVPGPEISVTLTIGCDWLYPALDVLDSISEKHPEFSSHLQFKEGLAHWDKFRTLLFDPNRYEAKEPGLEMPKSLKQSFLNSMDLGVSKNEVEGALDHWWQFECNSVSYKGPLPQAPEDRISKLRQWEMKEKSDFRL